MREAAPVRVTELLRDRPQLILKNLDRAVGGCVRGKVLFYMLSDGVLQALIGRACYLIKSVLSI